MLENELTANVARVIAQTEKHLLLEAKRLKNMGLLVNGVGKEYTYMYMLYIYVYIGIYRYIYMYICMYIYM
jgi:hypothetical protein